MENKIVLPRKDKNGCGYISYSQIYLWKTDKSRYFNSYFYGDEQKDNPYSSFGRRIGEALETNDLTSFSKEEKEVLENIPRLEEFEKMIDADFGDFKMRGYIDSNTKDLSHIIDYKTGTEEKIEFYKSESYKQLEIYSLALYKMYGVLPKKAEVVLCEVIGKPYQGESMKIGKSIWRIEREITEQSIAQVEDEIRSVVREISNHYKAFLNLKTIKLL